MPHHVASIVTIFQLLQTNWIRVGRARHSNSDYNLNRLLHLASAYNSGYRYCDKLQKTRAKGRWNENARVIEKKKRETERKRENTWNSNVGERMDYENPRALPARVPESNYGSSGSIAAKNQGRKRPAEKAEETNLSGLSSARMTRTERIWSPDTFIGFNELIKRIRAGRCGWAARCAYRCLTWHPNKKHRETLDDHLEENTCICVHHNTDPPISHDIYIMTRSSGSTLGAIELATSPALTILPSLAKCALLSDTPVERIIFVHRSYQRIGLQDYEFCYLTYRWRKEFIFCVLYMLLILEVRSGIFGYFHSSD